MRNSWFKPGVQILPVTLVILWDMNNDHLCILPRHMMMMIELIRIFKIMCRSILIFLIVYEAFQNYFVNYIKSELEFVPSIWMISVLLKFSDNFFLSVKYSLIEKKNELINILMSIIQHNLMIIMMTVLTIIVWSWNSDGLSKIWSQ